MLPDPLVRARPFHYLSHAAMLISANELKAAKSRLRDAENDGLGGHRPSFGKLKFERPEKPTRTLAALAYFYQGTIESILVKGEGIGVKGIVVDTCKQRDKTW